MGQDDRLDALAGAVSFYTQMMARDADQEREALLEELRRQQYAKFMESFGGSSGSQTNWVKI